MNAPLGWGVLGTGGIVRRWLPGFRAAGETLVAVGSRDRERRAAVAAELGAARGGTYQDVLADPAVEAVYVALPNALHAEWTIRAAEAGKHVLSEKPLAPSVAECEAVVAACARHGVHLVEGFMYRYHPRWRAVWRALEAGRIGEVRLVRAAFGFRMGPERDDDVRLSAELGGGALQDVGCYCVNATRWFLGEPRAVHGLALDRRGRGVDTHAAAVLEYPGGVLAELSCSLDSALGQSVEIVGERGRIELPRAFLPGTGEAPLGLFDADGEHRELIPGVDQYRLEVEAFRALVRDGTPTLIPGQDGVATQRVIAAWRASG
ncbi:MAG TPA: Gfo/Idh/MocA family oxidoreductase [Chloroflexota bacterium]|nr:Gfo/Idh/MocA family oxidoreductase [Chloroflexota bacterium]